MFDNLYPKNGRTRGATTNTTKKMKMRWHTRWQIALAVALSGVLVLATLPAALTATAAGSPSQLVFTTQPPADGDPGAALTSQPVVTIEDSSNGTVSSGSIITLTLTGPGGAALTGLSGALTCDQTSNGLTTLSASGGVAAFTGCAISRGGRYTLTATDATDNLTAVSSEFFISGPAQLAVTAQPGGCATRGARGGVR